MPNQRLNVSLSNHDIEILEELRDYYEKGPKKRLSWAEVVRTAIHRQHSFEKHCSNETTLQPK